MKKRVVYVRIMPDVSAFMAAMEQAAEALRLFGVTARRRKPLIHNGRKPR